MPAKILQLIIAAIFIVNNSYSQVPAIEWQKCYGGVDYQTSYNMQKTSDGGFVICGSISLNSQYEDVLVIKIDAVGNLLWQKSFPAGGFQRAVSIEQTTGGGYMVAGITETGSHGDYDCLLLRLNSSGDLVWQKDFGGSLYDAVTDMHATSDGGFVIASESYSSDGDITGNHGQRDCWIFKVDEAGNLIWQKSLGGSDHELAKSIIGTADGGYMVTATTNSHDGDVIMPASVVGASWIVKLDASLNIEWQKIYGVGLDGQVSGIIQTTDGGYAFTGINWYHGNHGFSDVWVARLDATGNMLWQSLFGGSEIDGIGGHLLQAADGGLIVPATTYSINGDVTGNHLYGYPDMWLIKVSPAGTLEWQKAMGGDGQDGSMGLCTTPDGYYIVAGFTTSDNSGDVGANTSVPPSPDVWVVKLGPAVLPVSLTGFNALIKEKNIECSWQTQQEQNCSHFTVERSEDALHFISLGNTPAKGNSTIPVDYSFIDKQAYLTGATYLYYRLKMVDMDGSFKYSDIVKLQLKLPQSLSIYPNPVVDLLTADFVSPQNEKATLVIRDQNGKKLIEQRIIIKEGRNAIPVNVALLPNGSYVLSVSGKNKYAEGFIK